MKKTISNLSNEEYDQILKIVAKELSQRNHSSYDLEIRTLKNVNRANLEIVMQGSLLHAIMNNYSDDPQERKSTVKELEENNDFLCEVSNYSNGTDEEKQFFAEKWIEIFSAARISYSVEIMKKIKKLRIENGFSQKEIANLLHISSQAYGNYENNKREPDLNTIILLARIFNVSLDFLVDHYNQKVLSKDFELKDAPHVAKERLSQPLSDFIKKLKSYNIADEQFSALSEEQIKIIVAIIKQNI